MEGQGTPRNDKLKGQAQRWAFGIRGDEAFLDRPVPQVYKKKRKAEEERTSPHSKAKNAETNARPGSTNCL